MSNKKSKSLFQISYDAPVTLSFAFICLILFFIDTYVAKGKLGSTFLLSPTSANGDLPFSFSDPLSYLRLIWYGFGGTSAVTLICNLIFVLLLGPGIEEKYGSVVIGIMMIFSALFSGVLNACFCTTSLKGCVSMVFMLIFLNSFTSFTNKKVPLSFIAVLILFILSQIYITKDSAEKINVVGLIINIAGGLCGSLFAFLASPKAKSVRKSSRNGRGLLSKAEQINLAEEIDSQSPRFKNKKDDDKEDGSTVIGTLKF